MSPEEESFYAKQWDSYVEEAWPDIKAGDEQLEWPGDEWGRPEGWEAIYDNPDLWHFRFHGETPFG